MSVTQDSVNEARSRLAVASRRRRREANPEAVVEARRDLTAATLERRIRETLAATPAITIEHRQSLAQLLLDGGEPA